MTIPNMNETDLVEDALQTWPIAQTPHGFSRRVLQRIETTPYTRFRFRFTWLDYALGFFVLFATLLAIFVWNMLPDLFIMQLTYRLFVLLHVTQYQSILIYSLFGIAGLLAFVTFAAILFTRPNAFNRNITSNSMVKTHLGN